MANCVQCGRKLPSFTFKKICQWCVQHEAAQRGEDNDAKQIVLPAPWVQRESSISLTQVILGANVMVFIAMGIAMILAGTPSLEFTGELRVHFGANFGPLTLSGDWWRLATYMFLHGDVIHIAMNLWCLWNLGPLCESLYGRWTFATVYVITGFAGGLASVAWNPQVLSVGASGAVFGLAGALIASFYLDEFSASGIAIKSTLSSLLFFAGFNLFFGSMFPGIDNACHIGGLVGGLILGGLIALIAPGQEKVARRVGVLAVVALLIAGGTLGVRNWRGAPYRIGRALQSLDENRADQAIRQLQAIAQQQPNSVEAHFALGQAYFKQENYPQSEAEFKRVLELQPDEADARFNLGLVYLNENRADDALSTFKEMVAQNSRSADGHYGLGIALADQEEYQAAVEEFKIAAQTGEPKGVYYELGHSYWKLKMYDEAIASYIKERDKTGDAPAIENALADAYQAKGMTQEAQEARSKAARLKDGK
jgi:membrane associated rhomboid family serine protease/Flp pilus assembly protein TadD